MGEEGENTKNEKWGEVKSKHAEPGENRNEIARGALQSLSFRFSPVSARLLFTSPHFPAGTEHERGLCGGESLLQLLPAKDVSLIFILTKVSPPPPDDSTKQC